MNALEQRHRKRSANREAPARRGDLRVGTSRRVPAGAIVEAATKMLRVPAFFEETGYLTLSYRVEITLKLTFLKTLPHRKSLVLPNQ